MGPSISRRSTHPRVCILLRFRPSKIHDQCLRLSTFKASGFHLCPTSNADCSAAYSCEASISPHSTSICREPAYGFLLPNNQTHLGYAAKIPYQSLYSHRRKENQVPRTRHPCLYRATVFLLTHSFHLFSRTCTTMLSFVCAIFFHTDVLWLRAKETRSDFITRGFDVYMCVCVVLAS